MRITHHHPMTESIRTWNVRRVAPTTGDWAPIRAASAVDAAQTHHMRSGRGCWLRLDGNETEDFALFEVEGFGEVISRCFFTSRDAVVRHPAQARDLADVARRLGVAVRLLEGRWEGESPHWQPRFAH
jgi:hypothetical protein